MWFTSLNFIKTFSHCFHIVYKLVYIYLNYTCKVLRNSHLQCRGCVWVHIIVTDRTNTHEWSLVCSYKAKLSTHLISFTSGILNIIPPLIPVPFFLSIMYIQRGNRGRDRMVVEFTTTYAISAYHHQCCEFESRSGRGVQHYVIKFVSDLRQVGGFPRVHRLPPPIKLTATI